MLNFQIVLLVYMAVGIAIHKFKLIDMRGRDQLSSLIINVFLPFAILNGFLNDVSIEVIRSSFQAILITLIAQVVCFAIAKALYRKRPDEQRRMLEYATATSNFSFLGLPSAEAAFGNDGYYLTAVSQIVYRIFLWGILTPPIIRTEHPERKLKWYAILKNPCMIALFIGLATLFLPEKPPQPLMTAVKGLASCSTPLCMVIVGYILLDIDWKKTPKALLAGYSLLRLILLPALVFGILYFLPIPVLTRNVVVLLTAMPAPSTAAIFAQKYKQDSNLTAQFVFITTVLSFVTVPFVVMALKTL